MQKNITKIVLHGNVTEDIITNITHPIKEGHNHSSEKFLQRLGGIKNVERAFNIIKPELPVEVLMYGGVSQAFIVISNSSQNLKQRTSFVDWEFGEIKALIPTAWNHIAYVDKLVCEFDKPEDALLSIDFVNSPTEKHIPIIQAADYVFCSLEDFNQTVKDNAKTCIIHSPKMINVLTKENEYFYSANDLVSIPNPIGAGDTFAACMIYGIITHQELNLELLETVYIHTLSILKEDTFDKFTHTVSR